MIHLMNSAMMPTDGIYEKKTVSESEWCAAFLVAIEKNEKWTSYIGYPETAELLSDVLGVVVPVSRQETVLSSGDRLFVARLVYRVDPKTKGEKKGLTREDLEFSIVFFGEK